MVVPCPTALDTSIQPSCCFTMPYTVGRPSPIPLPTSLVVKKGSNSLARFSSEIPTPVSVTVKRANLPGRASGFKRAASASTVT